MATAIETKERPILFSAEMVRAILDDRKTQTRRIIKPQPPSDAPRVIRAADLPEGEGFGFYDEDDGTYVCPYGRPGERLWVRERFLPCKGAGEPCKPSEASYVCYWDGCQLFPHNREVIPWGNPSPPKWEGYKFSPSIHMPRWASRITLEVARVRIEHLKDITAKDVAAEGYPFSSDLDQFKLLWNKLNGKRGYPWESDPRVWVIEFKKVQS
jgi:hypothetical protein